MQSTTEWKKKIQKDEYKDRFRDIYVDEGLLDYQKNRYLKAIEKFEKLYGAAEVAIYSAPGRSEVGGNHTDHQHGEILAASINLDAIAITKPLKDYMVRITSEDYEEIVIDLGQLDYKDSEKMTTTALIKGVLSGLKQRGYQIGGFASYITSDVLIGAGLSSSAAFETVIGTIVSYLYNEGCISAVEIAMIGQYAENVYFGKPCGLMDQMACSVGNLVHVDFENPENPKVEKISFDMDACGYSLCIIDTKGSHADLTADYAAVTEEMKDVANYYGKEVLLGLTMDNILSDVSQLRSQFGDRSVLRSLHFILENERVKKEVDSLKNGNLEVFLAIVKESGDSSYKYLQNVYSNGNIKQQNISLALAFSEYFLGKNGVCRVHGGGFAGTIQAFVKNEIVSGYKEKMDEVFGKDSCSILKIRKYGGMEV